MPEIKISRSIRRAVNLAAHKVGLAAAAAEKERLIAEIVSQRKADAQMPLLELHRLIGLLAGVDETLTEKENDHE